MRRGLFWAAAFLTALLHAGDLMAAIASKRDGVRPEMTWNPRPEQDDILLPMPCGLKMALRAVAPVTSPMTLRISSRKKIAMAASRKTPANT